jgi:hypothetical protein
MKTKSLSHTHHQRFNTRGSITVVSLTWFAVTFMTMAAVTHVGSELLQRQRAQHAADAIALAWMDRGETAGRQLAGVYGVRLMRVESDADRVRVWVQRGDHNASATAQYTQ